MEKIEIDVPGYRLYLEVRGTRGTVTMGQALTRAQGYTAREGTDTPEWGRLRARVQGEVRDTAISAGCTSVELCAFSRATVNRPHGSWVVGRLEPDKVTGLAWVWP